MMRRGHLGRVHGTVSNYGGVEDGHLGGAWLLHVRRVLKYFPLMRMLKYFSKPSFPGEGGPTTKLYIPKTGCEIKRVHVHLI